MSAVHCLTLGSRAIAVKFPDSETEPVAEYLADLLQAANAVAYLTRKEHALGSPFPGHVAGGMAAVELLTILASALLEQAAHDKDALPPPRAPESTAR